jgi:hypothetical protein
MPHCAASIVEIDCAPEWCCPSNIILLHHDNTYAKNYSDTLLFICTCEARKKEQDKGRQHQRFARWKFFFNTSAPINAVSG